MHLYGMKTLFGGLFLLSLVLALTGCNKDGPVAGLPPATQTGQNTAGFLLNGQPWMPAKNPSLPGNSPVGATWAPKIFKGGKSLQIFFSRHPTAPDGDRLHLTKLCFPRRASRGDVRVKSND